MINTFAWLPPQLGLVIVIVVAFVICLALVRALDHITRDRREADRRAEKMLAEILSASEWEQLNQKGYLEVSSRRHANRVYRVPRYQGMVSVYENGTLLERLCVGSATRIPDGDTVLLHKMMIEGNEEEYLRVANHFTPGPYSTPL